VKLLELGLIGSYRANKAQLQLSPKVRIAESAIRKRIEALLS
jgi:hypothetical protein